MSDQVNQQSTTSLPLRAASAATAGPFSSIRIVLDWRRKHPAVDASGEARADRACLAVRRDKLLRPSGIPGFAGSPVLFRRGLCRRDHNNRQRSCVHGQCEKPYRKFAHAPLPLRRNTTKTGLQKGSPIEAVRAFGYCYFSTSTTYLRITLANLSRWGARSAQAFDL